jgi:Kef-type K+ transport system membrane component KefB/predicted transcriptional regulator
MDELASIAAEFLGRFHFHFNVLLLLGLAVFGGTIGARIFRWIRIPQVVGYVVIGLVIGQSGLGLVSADAVRTLEPINYFALGLIGFVIGGELHRDVFRRYGRQFLTILVAEGIGAFLLAGVASGLIAWLFLGSVPVALSFGLLLGAISSATAPAATINVIWECKARGPLTSAVTAIVALDDGMALLLFALAASVADSLLGASGGAVWGSLAVPVYEIGGAVLIGAVVGLALDLALKRLLEADMALPFTVSLVLLGIGLARALQVDMILAAMVLGLVVANRAPRRTLDVFETVEKFAGPIYVLFFVFVGARLHVAHMSWWIVALGLAYVLGRSAGKILGARFGSRLSGAPGAVRRYLGLCLFSQGGVAIGLAILASHRFAESACHRELDLGAAIVGIVTATTLVVELLGPPLEKLALKKAGEIGLNVTEEDLIAVHNVRDLMDADPPTLAEETPLPEILKTLAQHAYLAYPVVDEDRRLLGLASFETIKETLGNEGVSPLLVAYDLMTAAPGRTLPETPLADALELMRDLDVQDLPVMARSGDDTLVGMLDSRAVTRALTRELLERERRARPVS